MSSHLTRLLAPKSIALFGGDWAKNVIDQLQKAGYAGEIWPVHPKRENINGIQCFASIADLPSAPDASFIGVNRQLTIEIIRELSSMGAGGATCFASGFLESETESAGGADLQAQLIEAAGDMPILGPNCYGLINYLENISLWPDQHGGQKVDKGVAILGQSSNILINITMQKRGLPITHVVAAGNQAQTQISDIGLHLLDNPDVTAIGLYIEGFGDIRKLEKLAAHARALNKPIVAIKTGKSEKSQAATLSHTASLAGNAESSSALMRRLGIIEVSSIAVFIETLKLLHVCGPLKGNAVSSMSCSGGEAGLIADIAEGSLIDFRGFSEKQYRAIKDVLGPLVTVSNPLDYHTFIWSDEEKLFQCYKAVLDDQFDLNVLIMDLPHEVRCDRKAWLGPLRAIKRAKAETTANVGLLATLPENLDEEIARELIASGIIPMNGAEEMISAIEGGIKAGRLTDQTPKPALLNPRLNDENVTLNEAASKSELSQFGLRFPENRIVSDISQIEQACDNLAFPIVLKTLGIAHKSEAGAVALNLHSAEEVKAKASQMPSGDGFLVEEMITEPVAELLIGVTRDPIGSFLLTIGAGGVLTELLEDTASLIIPAERSEILESISSLRLSKLLNGYRGKPAADMNAILDAIEAIQSYVIENPGLLELDINPLMALPEKAIAVDALIVKEIDE